MTPDSSAGLGQATAGSPARRKRRNNHLRNAQLLQIQIFRASCLPLAVPVLPASISAWTSPQELLLAVTATPLVSRMSCQSCRWLPPSACFSPNGLVHVLLPCHTHQPKPWAIWNTFHMRSPGNQPSPSTVRSVHHSFQMFPFCRPEFCLVNWSRISLLARSLVTAMSQ